MSWSTLLFIALVGFVHHLQVDWNLGWIQFLLLNRLLGREVACGIAPLGLRNVRTLQLYEGACEDWVWQNGSQSSSHCWILAQIFALRMTLVATQYLSVFVKSISALGTSWIVPPQWIHLSFIVSWFQIVNFLHQFSLISLKKCLSASRFHCFDQLLLSPWFGLFWVRILKLVCFIHLELKDLQRTTFICTRQPINCGIYLHYLYLICI